MRIGKEFGEFLEAVQSSPVHLSSFPIWNFSPEEEQNCTQGGLSKASVSAGAAWYSIWITDECVITFETLK